MVDDFSSNERTVFTGTVTILPENRLSVSLVEDEKRGLL